MTNSAYRMGPPPQPQPAPKEDDRSFLELITGFIGALVLLAMAVAWYAALGLAGALIAAQVVVTGLHEEHVTTGLLGPLILIIAAEAVIAAGVSLGVRSAEAQRRKADARVMKRAHRAARKR